MSLLIAGQPFEITSASLVASVIDPKHAYADGFTQSGLLWRLEINTRGGISFWHDDIQLPGIQRWTDLVGQGVRWNEQSNQNIDEWDVGWYGAGLFCANSEILQTNLRFVEKSGCKFHVQWMGIASTSPLGSHAGPEERLPFAIDCWCDFIGVSVLGVRKIGASAKRELIAQFLDIEDFSEAFVDEPHSAPGSTPVLMPLR